MKTIIAALALALAFPALATADQLEEIATVERALWDAWGKGDGETFGNNVTEDAIMAVAGAGVTYGRDKAAADVAKGECELKDYNFSELKLKKLGRKAALLSYKATQDASCGGQPLPKAVFVTAVYVKEGRAWQAATHHELVISPP